MSYVEKGDWRADAPNMRMAQYQMPRQTGVHGCSSLSGSRTRKKESTPSKPSSQSQKQSTTARSAEEETSDRSVLARVYACILTYSAAFTEDANSSGSGLPIQP